MKTHDFLMLIYDNPTETRLSAAAVAADHALTVIDPTAKVILRGQNAFDDVNIVA